MASYSCGVSQQVTRVGEDRCKFGQDLKPSAGGGAAPAGWPGRTLDSDHPEASTSVHVES